MQLSLISIISLLGSIGLFLYGMKVMSDGLMGIAGDRMRQLLATLTSKRVYAILTGLLITGAIQSSSATTLMIVSFVNANLLTLTESIGVIMGANIGTTFTAWLISILGFRVNISVIALPVVGLGVILSFSSKVVNKQSGNFLIGFGLLFIGLQFLQDFLPDLEKSPDALAFITEMTDLGFGSILLFLVITQKAIQADVVKSGKLYNLLREKVITIEMATSLMNVSAIVVRVIRNLVRITELLYIRRDRLLEF